MGADNAEPLGPMWNGTLGCCLWVLAALSVGPSPGGTWGRQAEPGMSATQGRTTAGPLGPVTREGA